MGSVAISVFINIILGGGLAPGGPTLELDVVDVDTSIDDVDINTLTTSRVVLETSENSETKSLTVRDTCETLKEGVITYCTTKPERNSPMERIAKCPLYGILFDISNLQHLPNTLDDGVGETTRIILEATVVHLTDTNGSVSQERVLFMSGLKEVEVVVHGGGMEVVGEGCECKRRPLLWNIMRSR